MRSAFYRFFSRIECLSESTRGGKVWQREEASFAFFTTNPGLTQQRLLPEQPSDRMGVHPPASRPAVIEQERPIRSGQLRTCTGLLFQSDRTSTTTFGQWHSICTSKLTHAARQSFIDDRVRQTLLSASCEPINWRGLSQSAL